MAEEFVSRERQVYEQLLERRGEAIRIIRTIKSGWQTPQQEDFTLTTIEFLKNMNANGYFRWLKGEVPCIALHILEGVQEFGTHEEIKFLEEFLELQRVPLYRGVSSF